MTTESSKANGKPSINTDSHLSDAERSFLAQAAYQKSPSVKVAENIGDWTIVGRTGDSDSGLEIYAFKQKGSNEVVFAVRGTDNEPTPMEDLGPNGADWAFSGKLHPQMEEAIRFVDEFMNDRDNIRENYTYSTTGHSKGGGIAQVLAHTFGMKGTALDPEPGGAVVDCHDYNGLMTDLDFDLPGIPDYGFTSL